MTGRSRSSRTEGGGWRVEASQGVPITHNSQESPSYTIARKALRPHPAYRHLTFARVTCCDKNNEFISTENRTLST